MSGHNHECLLSVGVNLWGPADALQKILGCFKPLVVVSVSMNNAN